MIERDGTICSASPRTGYVLALSHFMQALWFVNVVPWESVKFAQPPCWQSALLVGSVVNANDSTES